MYVFTGAGSSWTQTQKVTYSGYATADPRPAFGAYNSSLVATQKEIFIGGEPQGTSVGVAQKVIRYRI